jgi:E3 ubiquitin-protein ligase RNF14
MQSVYPEYTTRCEGPQADQTSPVTIRLEVPVDFDGERDVEIALEDSVSGDGGESPHQQLATLQLSNLPPLLITLLLPPTYPLRVSPLLIHFHSTNSYLRAEDVETIHKKLMDIWEEDLDAGTGTLWRTCEWLRSGTFLEDIGLAEPLRPIRCVVYIS